MPNGNIGHRLMRAVDVDPTFEGWCERQKDHGLAPQALRRLYEEQKNCALYKNDLYMVAVDKNTRHGFPGMKLWHLSIKRNDRLPITDWRDVQTIKNQICGEEAEAVQLFPAESRLVDTSNQYHLYAFMRVEGRKLPRLPLGWTERSVTDEPGGGAVQRPREETS